MIPITSSQPIFPRINQKWQTPTKATYQKELDEISDKLILAFQKHKQASKSMETKEDTKDK